MAMNNQKYEYKQEKTEINKSERDRRDTKDIRTVNISVFERNVEKDLHDVGGVKGMFHAITIPAGTLVEGKDLGGYKLLVRSIDIENRVASVRFSADRKLTLSKEGSKVKVNAGELNEGLGKLYIRMFAEQEKEQKEQREEYSL